MSDRLRSSASSFLSRATWFVANCSIFPQSVERASMQKHWMMSDECLKLFLGGVREGHHVRHHVGLPPAGCWSANPAAGAPSGAPAGHGPWDHGRALPCATKLPVTARPRAALGKRYALRSSWSKRILLALIDEQRVAAGLEQRTPALIRIIHVGSVFGQ